MELKYDPSDLKQAVETLKSGGIILYPTDTIWGLGCDATSSDAVQKLFALKHRAPNKSMLVLVGSEAQLERTVTNVPDVAWQLIEAADSPMTIIYDHAAPDIAPQLVADDGSLGVRITGETFSRKLCERLGKPLVSTSANLSGGKTATTFTEIDPMVKAAVDYVVKFRQDDNSETRPSAIIKISDSAEIKIIR